MKRLPISELKPGMVLGRNIYNANGGALLRRGVELTSKYIKALGARGFVSAYVCDGIADEIVPEDIVSERVRTAARKHTHDLFNLVYRSRPEATVGRRDTHSNLVKKAAPLVARLCSDVQGIVEQVLSVDAIDGVISLKSHDNYTFEHSVEVTVVAVLLGKRLALAPSVLRQLALGSILHDIGKLSVSKEILSKREKLTDEEFAIVRQHPQTGYDMMRELLPDEDLLARHVIWQHHERQDGMGYPRGLRGYNSIVRHLTRRFEMGRILLVGEIAAVADVYSALGSDRPYRRAMEPTDIVKSMEEMAGAHLNRELVKRFLSILPVYPPGTEVVIVSRELRNYRGVVVNTTPGAVDRPLVRVLFNAKGKPITPFEIDTNKDKEIQLNTPRQVLQTVS